MPNTNPKSIRDMRLTGKRTRIHKPKHLMLAGLFSMCVVACAPVDRWQVFQPDYEEALRRAEFSKIEVPEEAMPHIAETPPMKTPAAGEPIELSVEEAIVMSLRYNRDLKVQELNPVIAGTFEMIERGVYDPEVFAEGVYARQRAVESSQATGERFGVEDSETTSTVGIRQRLPTGTLLEATVGHQGFRSNRAPEEQSARVGLSVTQSLLRGFGPSVNLVSIRQAEIEQVASLYELQGYTEALMAETETAYWYYVLAAQEIAIFENALDVARQQRDEIEQRIEVGMMPKTEAAAARAEVALREQALIDARSQLESRRLRLVQLIGPGPAGGLDLQVRATSKAEIRPRPISDLAERLQLAERSRPDVNEASLRLRQNRLEVLLTKNGLLPRLELFAALGKTGYSDSFSGSFRGLDQNDYDFSAGVRFSQFLGNRAARGRNLAALANRRQSVEALANLLQVARLDVRLAVNEVERARRQIAASAATRALQDETLKAEEERFEVGASTSLLVAQAQRDLLAAQIAEVEAIVKYRIALIQLYLAEGSLLERRGVRLASEKLSVNPS